MLSVNSMLNQDQHAKSSSASSSPPPLRPTVLNISHLLCDPPMKSPSLSPSSSPSPTDSFPFPFAQELHTPTSSPFSSTSSLHYTNHSDFALHSRPYLPTTTTTEEIKRRSPSLLDPPPTLSICGEEEALDRDDEDDLDDDQLSIHSKTSSSSSTTTSSRLKAKRRRANAKQLQILNQVFDRTFFPSTQMRAELGRQLGMSPRTVQIWFQNKRQAMRTRERQRLLTLKD